MYEDIITNKRKYISKKKHPLEYSLFHNLSNKIDGNVYGVLFNKLGVAIGGFPTRESITDP